MSAATAAAWLEDAATELDARGDHALAAEARVEAAALVAAPAPAPVVQHCDRCGVVVAGLARLAYYGDTLGVDWVLCARCDRPIPSAGMTS